MYPIKYGIEGSVFFLNLILSFLSKRYIFTSWSIFSVFGDHYLEIDNKAYFRFMQVHSLSSIHTLPIFYSFVLYSYFCPSHLILCLAFLSYHSLVFILILEPSFLNLILYPELGTFDFWISGLMLDLLFFFISRLNNACSPLVINL